MNFEEIILPLTQFLLNNGFFVSENSLHFREYFSDSIVITAAYDSREYVFYFHVGVNKNSLIELTPKGIKIVFNEDHFQFQSNLTIGNFIAFLKGKGNAILCGDTSKIKELNEFSDNQSKEYTASIMHLQNLRSADNAWTQKNYADFIKCIERMDQALLPISYLKKYQIALKKL